MKLTAACFSAVALCLGMSSARADDFVTIPNTALLKWYQVNGTAQIFLRNLSDFDSTFSGCCFNYYIDISSTSGKVLWATILVKMASAQPITLAVSSKAAGGVIISGGVW